jgi:hypothetical protein
MGQDSRVVYYNNTNTWQNSPGDATRDDTTATANSYAVIQITSSFKGT